MDMVPLDQINLQTNLGRFYHSLFEAVWKIFQAEDAAEDAYLDLCTRLLTFEGCPSAYLVILHVGQSPVALKLC